MTRRGREQWEEKVGRVEEEGEKTKVSFSRTYYTDQFFRNFVLVARVRCADFLARDFMVIGDCLVQYVL